MRYCRFALFAVLLMAAISVASAQGGPGRGMRGGMMGGLGLLRMESVQKELKMTPEQINKIDDKQQDVQGQMRDLFQSSGGFQNMSPEDRQKLMEKGQEIQHKAVADILDSNQMKRFDELELQRTGPSALTRKSIAEKLKLTDDQRKSLADIQQSVMQQRRDAMSGGNFQDMTDEERQKFREKMQQIQKAADDKMLAVLNADQQKQWKDMLGEPFKFGPPPGARNSAL